MKKNQGPRIFKNQAEYTEHVKAERAKAAAKFAKNPFPPVPRDPDDYEAERDLYVPNGFLPLHLNDANGLPDPKYYEYLKTHDDGYTEFRLKVEYHDVNVGKGKPVPKEDLLTRGQEHQIPKLKLQREIAERTAQLWAL